MLRPYKLWFCSGRKKWRSRSREIVGLRDSYFKRRLKHVFTNKYLLDTSLVLSSILGNRDAADSLFLWNLHPSKEVEGHRR